MSRTPADEPVGIDPGLERAWREASRDEPPPALDDAIRAAARKAVRAGPRATGAGPFGGRWRVPLSVAAVLVVSATVTLLVAERDRQGLRSFQDQATPAPSAVAPAADSLGARAVSAEPEPAAQATQQQAPPARSELPAQRQREMPGAAQPDVAERKAIRSPLQTAAADRQKKEPEAQAQRADQFAESLPAAPVAEVAQEGPGAGQVELGAAARAPAAAPSPRSAEALRDAMPSAADQPAPVEKAAPGSVRAGKESAAEEARVAPPRPQATPGRSAAKRSEPSAFPAAPEAAPAEDDAVADGESREPKAWLERILELRRRGKLEEADRSLKAFRERYPDYPLPPELSTLR